MRRIRIALSLVSVAALGLVALLTWRALEGLAMERALTHEAVARRAFDEMEHALSRALAREEDRPFEHYAFYVPGTNARSPLATEVEPFVVGAFQVDPDGRITTPLEPTNPAAAQARGDWPPRPEIRDAIARVRRTAERLWRADDEAETFGREGGRNAPAPSSLAKTQDPAPGSTRALSGPGVSQLAQRVRARADEAKGEDASVLDALRSLSGGAEARSDRRQKVVTAPQRVAEPQRVPAAEAEPAAPTGRLFERAQGGGPPQAGILGSLSEELQQPVAQRAANVRITIDPMVGVAAAADTLVLYRTVLVGQRGYRQGLVIDRPRLAAWLGSRVLGGSRLARVARLSFGPPSRPPDDGEHYVFAHRFAEPFDSVNATLVLAALPGVGSPWAIYALVASLLAVSVGGLVAVHRTAAVVVQYAERRSNFVSAVTHELKTPLTAIRMYAEMLRDGLVPSEAKRREYYGTITDESERLSRLVDNVLEFSRLESGRRDLQSSAGAVAPLLEEAAAKLRAHARRCDFQLEVVVEPDLPAIRFDRDALLQVLFNLVDNAMKYARDARVRVIRLEARRRGSGVAVAVRDFGPGVVHGHQERIFEPFYRGEVELTRTTQGTGIGLALVKELAERMGAGVGSANVEDGGFRVTLDFPSAEPS